MHRTILLVLIAAAHTVTAATVTILHFSDYHSHAIPFYSEDRPDQGGIARAIGYLSREKARGALVFGGGDMMNKGAPAWSDKYRCAEWSWFNGIVDAMALGNHDVDYGFDTFQRCRAAVQYPIISANTKGFAGHAIFTVDGVRIGVFAVAGPDFPGLMKQTELPFGDSVAAARDTVRKLREDYGVNAVVMIGHERTDDDYILARAVRGIDLILGTHSHLKRSLTRIPDTDTWFISPFQYLTYISRVELNFDGTKLRDVSGSLIRVDRSMAAQATIARRVRKMQGNLERDPAYASLFKMVACLKVPMSVEDVGKYGVESMREATGADIALSTVSSFRQPLPRGELNLELLRAALPYDNEIVIADISGAQLEKLISLGESSHGTEPAVRTALPRIDRDATYRVAATDYLAGASGYAAFFTRPRRTGLRVREEMRKRLALSRLTR